MGSDLYTQFVTARTVIDECDAILQKKLKSLMFNGPAKALTATQIAQPAIVCHSIALLRVFESECGFKVSDCELALGHSLGEYSVLVATESIR